MPSPTEESEINREAREVAEQLEALLPKARAAMAYADDDLAMRVGRIALNLAVTAKSIDSAKGVLLGD